MALATKWGVSQSFIGIAIIGLGTSLPELAVSIGAAIRKSAGMSVGNVIGSNIFDGLIPIGLGGIISTTNMERNLLNFDLPVLLAVTLLVLIFLRTKRGISKPEGVALIVIYLSYIAIKIFFVKA
ncbi:MAG: sodium:calcium antiporter, partial [Bacteroidetes bacterium]|nr:sodium:calcium antiporter [Bacteroidota bacterium]